MPSRREFCSLVGASLLPFSAGSAPAFAAAASPAPALGTVNWQVGWLKGVAYAGSYIADTRGYYRAQGIEVDILAGGPNVAVPPLVVAGHALVGQSTIGALAAARSSGAPLKVVAAWPRNPEVFISLASKPIRTPRELIGKRLGVPSADLVDVKGFLQTNGIAPEQVQFVPVQFDPAPLVAGQVDAYLGYSVNEPLMLAMRGVSTYELHVDDFGYSGLFQVYFVAESSLADPVRRAQLKAFFRGERLGWRECMRDPDLGVHLTLTKYGSNLGLDPKLQALQMRATNALLATPETHGHGLFSMSPAAIERCVAVLQREGIPAQASDLFDTTLLDEIDATPGAPR